MPTPNPTGPWRRFTFHNVLHPLLWLLLVLAVMAGVVVVLVDHSSSLVDVQQVEQPAGWLIV